MAFLFDNVAHSGAAGPLTPKVNADGTVYMYAYAAAGATRNVLGDLITSQYGWRFLAIADASDVQSPCYAGVPKSTLTSGQYGWFQIGGAASDVVITTTTGTVGHAVKRASDAALSAGGVPTTQAYMADGQFGIFLSTGSTATYNILLFPERIDLAD